MDWWSGVLKIRKAMPFYRLENHTYGNQGLAKFGLTEIVMSPVMSLLSRILIWRIVPSHVPVKSMDSASLSIEIHKLKKEKQSYNHWRMGCLLGCQKNFLPVAARLTRAICGKVVRGSRKVVLLLISST